MKVPSLLAIAIATAVLVACADRSASNAPAVLPSKAAISTAPMVGVHYFGNAWPKNFIGGFRRGDVRGDFARIAADGFNTVVLLVSWGDFQPGFAPCCQYDERAWERLHFLLAEADRAGLEVVLRVGYAWTFHPQAGDSSDRVHRLMNQAPARTAYQAFTQRLGREIADQPQVTLALMSWEDQWLRHIDDSARPDYAMFQSTRRDLVAAVDGALPTADGDQAEAFNAYWDWLVMERLYQPSRAALPMLSYEARVDKEPDFVTDANGQRSVRRWLGHPGMLRLAAGVPVTIYWAPFWGARNQGEQLSATESLRLFDALLADVHANAPGAPIFIDQFNVVDNTPGHETNAVIAPDQLSPFLSRAVCSMKANGVVGYAWWAGRDYTESPLYNPAFGYGLDGWQWLGAGDGRTALEAMPVGDFQLRLKPGDGIMQRIALTRGRLPKADAFPDRVCVTADSAVASNLVVRAGSGATTRLEFAGSGVQTQCADISPVPAAEGASLDLVVSVGKGELALRDVQVFDHVQDGGLYDHQGQPGRLLDSVRRMNAEFLKPGIPARCAPPPAPAAPVAS